MNEQIPNGAAEDTRTADQKALDYKHEEILGSGVYTPNWLERKNWKTLTPRNQITSSSCGAQAGAKAIEAFLGVVASAGPIYRKRSNFSGAGMIQWEIGEILKKSGTNSEALITSENITEEQLNAQPLINSPLPYKIGSYYMLPSGAELDMDLIAKALDSGHAVIPLIRSNNSEYGAIPTISGQTTFAHFVCCVPSNYILHNGEKSLVIDDSCAPHSTINGSGQRIFTESWLKARSYGILALVPAIPAVPIPTTIHYHFTKDMSYTLIEHDADVRVLQDILKLEGCMDKSIPSTGNFREATKAAVIKLQNKYAEVILKPAGLTVATGYCGLFTRNFLNHKYA